MQSDVRFSQGALISAMEPWGKIWKGLAAKFARGCLPKNAFIRLAVLPRGCLSTRLNTIGLQAMQAIVAEVGVGGIGVGGNMTKTQATVMSIIDAAESGAISGARWGRVLKIVVVPSKPIFPGSALCSS